MNSTTTLLAISIALLGPRLAASHCSTHAPGVLCQEPKPQRSEPREPVPTPAGDILDAEREKLRMKDVEGWKKLQVKSLDQVIDVKKTTNPVELPASVTDAERTRLAELLEKAKDGGGGARTGRALREMEKMGYPAMLFLINALREIDYRDPESAMFGMQINTTLTAITMGVNTGYVAVEVGQPMDPRKAQYNALTVKQWIDAVSGPRAQWPTRQQFDEFIAKRKAKKDAELEQDPATKGETPGKDVPPKKN